MRAIGRRFLLAAALVAAASLAACNKGGGGAAASADDMTMGDANAKVTVVEYASASCTHCAAFNATVFPEFKKKYVDTGQVKYVFREFLTPPVPFAAGAFLLARCAGEDKYFTVVDAVFRSHEEVAQTQDFRTPLQRIGQSAGLSEEQFNACMADEKAQAALNARVEKAVKDGISSTPTFLVNGKKIKEGEITMAELDAAIQPLLK